MPSDALRFLHPAELKELTGLSQKATRIRWLHRQRALHYVRADAKPVVPRAAVEGRHEKPTTPRAQPNFDAIRPARPRGGAPDPSSATAPGDAIRAFAKYHARHN